MTDLDTYSGFFNAMTKGLTKNQGNLRKGMQPGSDQTYYANAVESDRRIAKRKAAARLRAIKERKTQVTEE